MAFSLHHPLLSTGLPPVNISQTWGGDWTFSFNTQRTSNRKRLHCPIFVSSNVLGDLGFLYLGHCGHGAGTARHLGVSVFSLFSFGVCSLCTVLLWEWDLGLAFGVGDLEGRGDPVHSIPQAYSALFLSLLSSLHLRWDLTASNCLTCMADLTLWLEMSYPGTSDFKASGPHFGGKDVA